MRAYGCLMKVKGRLMYRLRWLLVGLPVDVCRMVLLVGIVGVDMVLLLLRVVALVRMLVLLVMVMESNFSLRRTETLRMFRCLPP